MHLAATRAASVRGRSSKSSRWPRAPARWPAAAAAACRGNCASTNRPRFTGEVRSGFEVTNSALACVSTPPRGLLGGQRHAPHLGAGDAGYAVQPRELLVEEGVVAVDEFGDRPVFAHDVPEDTSRFPGAWPCACRRRARRALRFHRGVDAGREPLGRRARCRARNAWRNARRSSSSPASRIDDLARIDWRCLRCRAPEPLAGEVLREAGPRAFVGQHALDLRPQLLAQLAAGREREQLVVGHRRPQEIGQARGQRIFIDVRDLRRRMRRGAPRAGTGSAGDDKHRRHGLRHALFEGLARLAIDVLGEQREAVRRHRRSPAGDMPSARTAVASPSRRRGASWRGSSESARGKYRS